MGSYQYTYYCSISIGCLSCFTLPGVFKKSHNVMSKFSRFPYLCEVAEGLVKVSQHSSRRLVSDLDGGLQNALRDDVT